MGEYVPGKSFGIETDKSVQLLGDRVWLITRASSPPRYCLCETFLVEEIDRKRTGKRRNVASSRKGESFTPPVQIDSASWFPALREKTGNFAFGLQRIKDRRIIEGLTRVATGARPSGIRTVKFVREGAGFGDWQSNRRVERAAVSFVTRDYEARGWRVESREADCIGYDLFCWKGRAVHHVETKGISGSICSFPLTANEKTVAETDPDFRLIAVTHALDKRERKLNVFTGRQLIHEFDFVPLTFIVKVKK